MGMVAAGYGDSLRGGIMSLNALKMRELVN